MISSSKMFRAVLLAVATTIATALPALAQVAKEETQPQTTRTVGDGVFTIEQALRGEQSSNMSCVICHSIDEWTSPPFLAAYMGNPVSTLFEVISTTMPSSNPGSLTPEEYADIIAYILQINGAPPGESELPGDKEELSKILMAAGPSGD